MAKNRFTTTGQSKQIKFKNGTHHEYFADGSLKTVGKYLDDKMDGDWKHYFKGGRIQSITTYVNGVKNGKYEKYSKDGKLVENYLFENDKKVK